MRRFLRLSLIIPYFLAGACFVAVCTTFGPRSACAQGFFRYWCRGLLPLLGVRVARHGVPMAGPILFAANHISWLDIIVVAGYVPLRFVAKDEIARWPVVGWLATRLGTLFIQRGSAGAAQAVTHVMADCLRGGQSVLVFPEGRTHPGIVPQRFFPRTFEAARQAACSVQGIALRYVSTGGNPCPHAPFVDEISFLQHFWSLLSVPTIRVSMAFCDTVPSLEESRTALARRVERQVHEAFDALQSKPC